MSTFAAREMAERAAGSSLPSRTWSMPLDTLSMGVAQAVGYAFVGAGGG